MVTIAHFTPRGAQIISEAIVRDISTEGMGAYVNYPYQKGDKLLVKINLTTPSKKIIKGSLVGWVSWVTKADEGKKYSIGLEFRDMEKQQPRLYTYLQGLEEISRTI